MKFSQKAFGGAVTHNKKVYLVPQAFQLNPIYYRKSVFDSLELKPPKTWQDLLHLCDTIYSKGLIPFTISARGWPPPVARWFTIFNLRLNGFEFHKNLMTGKESWEDPRVRNVFEHWKQLFEHHAFAEGSEDNSWNTGSREFYSKKAVMYNIGEWIFENPQNEELLNDVDFFTVPVLNENVDSAEIFHLYGSMLLKKGRTNSLSYDLLKFAAGLDSQLSNLKTLKTRTPSNKLAYGLMSALQKKQYDYIENVSHLVPLFEFSPEPEFVQFALGKFLEFWEDQSTIDEIMSSLEEKRKEYFEKGD